MMNTDNLKRIIVRSIGLYDGGMIRQEDTEYLDMIIAAHELKKADDPQAAELIDQLCAFMLETDRIRPLHYSLWLAVYQLLFDSLSDFLHSFDIQALKEGYDPEAAVFGMFHDRFDTKVSLPLSAHSALIREEVNGCLARNDHVSAAIAQWMAHEDEITRRRNSFAIEDVLSLYYAYTARVLNMDIFTQAEAASETVMQIQSQNGMNEIPLWITHVYDDMITALSLAKPLHLYRIRRDTETAECYRLSDQEYLGFHVTMFIADQLQVSEDTVDAVLMDPEGKRYPVHGTTLEHYPGKAKETEIIFPDGIKRKAAFHFSDRPFVLMERSRWHPDSLNETQP